MTVMRTGEGVEQLLESLHVRNDDLLVSHFDKYLKPGLPIVKELEEGDLDYYLDILEPYRGARTKFEGYRSDLQKMGTVGKVDGYIERTMTAVREWIQTQPDFQAFQNNAFEAEAVANSSSVYRNIVPTTVGPCCTIKASTARTTDRTTL